MLPTKRTAIKQTVITAPTDNTSAPHHILLKSKDGKKYPLDLSTVEFTPAAGNMNSGGPQEAMTLTAGDGGSTARVALYTVRSPTFFIGKPVTAYNT